MPIAVYPGKKSPDVARAVGRYELKEKLGEGGMGVVWRALDSRIGGDVALKIMKDCSDPAALELFSKEWRSLADLSHPNIVDVRDVDVLVEDGERKPFFVMPLLRGSTLADLIANSSERLTVARVVEIISQVCRGLQAAHQRGLVHRDLKPSNIFVMDDDTAKVIDFGVVYLAGSNSMTGQKGTFQYMSPEQMQMKEVTPASDLFAVGVILYEALSGRKPFACATIEETSQAVLKRIPPPVSELNPGISHAVSQVVHKCLAKQSIHRFSSARELADTLQRASRGEEVFDASKLRLRLERVKGALKTDHGFASELLSELESEGHQDSEITMLRAQVDGAMKQRKLRQLMESARARIEQGEIALGLDKLRELLELDPDNADALALKSATEKRRDEAQAERWMELGETHLGNGDFAAARSAVREALASRPGDPRALELSGRIENVEAEAKRVREQKEQLYNSAMNAYQHGEIDAALSRMVRLFSVVRSRPEGAIPERDAVYESFYEQVRSEHDSIRLLLEQAQREFSEERFQEALALCAEHLTKYPTDSAFQGLKIQIEDAERQKISSYIAIVTKNADAEPDLDRRANILREASERYPNEVQFSQQLKVVRERRDLVNSVVAKARQFDERGQYNEALSQWDTLRNIHPRYPGLNFELEQCRKKRDQQAIDEEKAREVDEIVRLMDARDFTKSLERTRSALKEYPADAELMGLEKLSLDGMERSQESNKLLSFGRAEAAAGNWEESADYMRRALKLDPRSLVVKEALIITLTEFASTLLTTDWAEAQRLQQEASALDGNHRAVRTLGTEISEARRQTYVGECLTEARALVAEGDYEGAYQRIRKGREEYRNDTRLEQYEAWLVKQNADLQVKQKRAQHLAELAAARQRLERSPDSEKARAVVKLSRDLSLQAPDDPDTMRGIADAEQTVKRMMGLDDLSSLLRPTTHTPEHVEASVEADATKLYQPATPPKPAAPVPVPPPTPPNEKGTGLSIAKNRNLLFAGAGGLLLLIACAVLLLRHHEPTVQKANTQPSIAVPVKVHVSSTPGDSVLRVAGAVVNGTDVPVPPGQTVNLEIARPGYKTVLMALDGKSTNVSATLEALPVRVSLATGEKSGSVEMDGNKVTDLTDGLADGVEVPADGQSHTVAVVVARKRLITFSLKANPGERPQVDPVSNKDVLIVSELGKASTVYGGAQLRNAALNGTPVHLSDTGTDLRSLGDGPNELLYVVGNDTASVSLAATDRPVVSLHMLGAGATMLVSSNVDNATLTVNGRPMRRGRGGWQITQPGSYQFSMAASGYETQSWTALLKPRQSLTDARKLVVSAAAAPALSTLLVAGGTAGAQIFVDNKLMGTLDEGGSAEFKGMLTEGPHQVQLRKEGFCDMSRGITARPPAELRLTDARLEGCGNLIVKAGSIPASVTLRRIGGAGGREIEMTLGKMVALPAGDYHLTADAPGETRFEEDITVKAGVSMEIPPLQFKRFAAARGCQVANAGDVTPEQDWLKPNGGKVVNLAPGCVSGITLTFGKPRGGILPGRRKVAWILYSNFGGGHIEYEIEGNKLRRKSSVSGDNDHAEVSSDKLKVDGDTFAVRILLDGQHVRMLSPNGDVVDEYNAQDKSLVNLRGGHMGVKTSGTFKFSGGGA
jgi:serine/threonine protein kinase